MPSQGVPPPPRLHRRENLLQPEEVIKRTLQFKGAGGARGGMKSVTSAVAFDRVGERRKSYAAAKMDAETTDMLRDIASGGGGRRGSIASGGGGRRGSIGVPKRDPLATPGAVSAPGAPSANGTRRNSSFACSMFTHEASRAMSAGERAIFAREAAEDREVNDAIDQVEALQRAMLLRKRNAGVNVPAPEEWQLISSKAAILREGSALDTDKCGSLEPGTGKSSGTRTNPTGPRAHARPYLSSLRLTVTSHPCA